MADEARRIRMNAEAFDALGLWPADINAAVKLAIDRWVKDHIAEFHIGTARFRIISLESVPEHETWCLDTTKQMLLKFRYEPPDDPWEEP